MVNDKEEYLIALPCQCCEVQDTQTVVSTIQNAHIAIRGLPVYSDRGVTKAVRGTLQISLLIPRIFKRRQPQKFYFWTDTCTAHLIHIQISLRTLAHLTHVPLSLHTLARGMPAAIIVGCTSLQSSE